MRPMMTVEDTWKTPRPNLTAEEQKELDRWCDEEHIPDLLRGTGMTRVTRYRDKDDGTLFWIQEFRDVAALEKYLISERRKELRRETESHYPAGSDPKNLFERRTVRIFIPIHSKAAE